jgi:Skp family chaperone for outer membrane proteins
VLAARDTERRGTDAGPAGGSTELEEEERRAVNKRTILLVAGIAAFGVAVYFGTRLGAQGGGSAAPVATRVGVVNVGIVFTKYEKAKVFKDELQKKVMPFKDKMDKWRKETIEYQDMIQKGDFSKYKKEDLEKAVVDRKRALEDTDREVRNLVGKQSEEQLVYLWREIAERVSLYGRQNGFHVVLGYGDPMDAKDLNTFANINRKMQGMDFGGVTPLYIADGLDISEGVVQSLNASYAQGSKAGVGAQK